MEITGRQGIRVYLAVFVLSIGASQCSWGADCNSNGVDDLDDIAGLTSQDCNTNGIPDECDLSDGASADCNSNGRPDECDVAVSGTGFGDAGSWQAYSSGATGGYIGVVFDGTYVYFVPWWKGAYAHGRVLRYDTRASFDSQEAWVEYDPGSAGLGSGLAGYIGAIFDGRYVYFVPYNNGVVHANVLRLDTQGDFESLASWSVFDGSTASTMAGGYQGGAYDGRYVYFSPYYDGSYRSEVLRYDTWSGDFTSGDSWEAYEQGVSSTAVGFDGAVFDGQYVYFVPSSNSIEYHGEVLRYNTLSAFDDDNSWEAFDPGDNGVGTDPDGYVGGVYDGRYVYFAPDRNGDSYHGEVLRFDTTGGFYDVESWGTFDAVAANVGSHTAGYNGAVFDGRYVYFVPNRVGVENHGEVLRYDTRRDFYEAGSWESFDADAAGVGSVNRGYRRGVFDGRYVYFAPARDGSNFHDEVLRFDTLGEGSPDCNVDDVPDECQLEGNDCNGNGIPDDCELEEDCNSNGALDQCDIESGTSADCQGDGVPDECQLAAGDCDSNGIPDVCEIPEHDCNSNGVLDACDIGAGTSEDCQPDGVPDECQGDLADCNSNGVIDECELEGADCNNNGVLDECEPAEDCNSNGVQDICDIAGGTSEDCQPDGVPDECQAELPDCNSNGVPDECDLVKGDCNSNGIVDECEIAAGSAEDCNVNSVPDQCEMMDCNSNGVLDACDVAEGTSVDCNGNLIPDNCELEGNDLNGNGILDECEGLELDCNSNGVLDELELEGNDCNENEVLDECDVGGGTSFDCQGNGIPDECELMRSLELVRVDFAEPLESNVGTSGLWHRTSECVLAGTTDAEAWAYFGLDDSCTFDNGTRVTGRLLVTGVSIPSDATSVVLEYYSAYGGERGLAPHGYDSAWVEVGVDVVDDAGFDTREMGVWEERVVDLIEYAGQSVEIAWVFDSVDEYENERLGWQVADVLLTVEGVVSNDCNDNEVPDDCELESQDCNSNGVPDSCDLSGLTSQDCNSNGMPDECDIASGTSVDCNGTGVPDECELAENDCNGNWIPDGCDVAAGTSSDCNSNGMPDECELGLSGDCNENGVPDACDIDLATSKDVNTNGLPDECERGACCFQVEGVCFEDEWREDCWEVEASYQGAGSSCEDGCVYADFDWDYDVDLQDFARFQHCAGETWPEGLPSWCEQGDFDRDGDVDVKDFGLLEPLLLGPGGGAF